MSRQWQQIWAALLLGLVIPGALQRLSLTVSAPKPELLPPATESTQTDPPAPMAVLIPVLTTGGEVVEMELETYLTGVLLAEVPASFEMEALKAQAVVARTYAMKRVSDGDRHAGGAVCMDSHCCQAYLSPDAYDGSQKDISKMMDAVAQTAGQVLTYQGELAEATYFSCSGGKTEDAVAVWGSDVPYLRSVDSPGEEQAQPYRNTVSFTPEAFAQALGRDLSGRPQDWLGVVTYTQGGGVATMVVAGISYSGVRLRQLLGLNSTAFSMWVADGNIFIATSGKGHRVGMSQYGADAMAATGSDYADILNHYYPGTKIDKLGAIG